MSGTGKDDAREKALDEAVEETFPASDPVAFGHSEHAGTPPGHAAAAETGEGTAAAVQDRPDLQRFELVVDGHVAIAAYRLEGDRIVLTHTEVPEALAGRGVGTRLATGVFDILRARDAKVVPRCPFMATFVARHPDYADLVAS